MKRYIDVIMAGFGGQGVLLIGNLLAYAGMNEKLNVPYIPVYGVEMRGGTANCTVVLSEDEIGSPIINTPKSLIVMNRPSLDKFQPKLADGGLQIVNSSLVDPELVEVGRHGLIMRQGGRQGLLLPQVPIEWGWDRAQFLAQTCRKAGLPALAWRDPSTEVYWFEAVFF